MEKKKSPRPVKPAYSPPKVLATYSKEKLEETIRPHGPLPAYGGCSGCGCGCSW